MKWLTACVVLSACSSTPITNDAGSDANVPDVAKDVNVDSSTCGNGKRDGDETDVDCGGSCAPCNDGQTCALESDCASQRCSGGVCGVRAWSIESSGNNLTIPGNQTWTSGSASSLYLTPQLYAASMVYLRWTGTLRFAGGGNGLCHVGQRFVIDDVPTGDTTWGNAIMVENGSTRWHETFTTEIAVPLGLGLHTIGVQMVNAQNYGNCYLDGDGGLVYDRSRLAVAAYDPKDAFYAESTGDTGNIGNSSNWVDIPGVTLAISLASPKHVQMALTGTEYVAGTGPAYCSYRLVIDGTPLGDPTYGQALAVNDPMTGWWSPVAVKWGQDMDAGAHTIKAQLSNTSTVGTCSAGQGNNGYAKFRLFATQSAQGGLNSSAESTGGPDILTTGSTWTPIPGLAASFTVTAPTQVQMEMAGIEETTNGTSGHCSWRFVLDGTPLGDPNYGQVINVGGAATAWWTTAALLYGETLPAGKHTVSVDIRNSSNSGDCGTNGDGKGYGRARLFVRVP
jgi:hypothetical protein